MARFSFDEADNYGGGTSSFFSLKDDGDVAVIRFLYNDINDVEGVSVHQVTVDGRTIDVECLRAYNEPISKCPLCEANYKVIGRLYIPVYDEDAKESKIWTRGKSYFGELSSLCSRYNPLVATPIELERIGKKGDTNTKYQPFPRQSDNAKIEDFPEIKAEGLTFQVKTADEMRDYLRTGKFDNNIPDRTSNRNESRRTEREMPVRRRPRYDNEESF